MSMSTTQLAERFGCVSMTLEMPFKDNFNLPDRALRLEPRALAAPRPRLHGRAPRDPAAAEGQGRAPDADAGPHPARPVAVEPREPLHRLVGRRPERPGRRRGRRRPASCSRRAASTSTVCFTSLLTRAIRTLNLALERDGPAVAAGAQGLAAQRAPLWRAHRLQQAGDARQGRRRAGQDLAPLVRHPAAAAGSGQPL